MRKLILNIFFFLISISVFSQYETDWKRYIGTVAKDVASDIIQSYDGNFVVVGRKVTQINEALWIVKFTASGIIIWDKKYKPFSSIIPVKIIETVDTGLFVVSNVTENRKQYIWLLRLDKNGEILWERLYGGENNAIANSATLSLDSGFVIVGYTFDLDEPADSYILKVDSLGFFKWDNVYGSPYEDRFCDITALPDGGYAVAGFFSFDKGKRKRGEFYKYDDSGNMIYVYSVDDFYWSKAKAVTYSDDDTSLVFAVEVIDKPLSQTNDIALYKIDTVLFDIRWQKIFSDNAILHPVKILSLYDGYVVLFTRIKNGIFNKDVGLVKFSYYGKLIWKKIFHRYSEDYATSIVEAKDYGLYVISTTIALNLGWNFGVVRFKNTDFTNIQFITPKKNTVSLPVDTVNLVGCFKAYKKPKKILVVQNGVVIDSIKTFKPYKDSTKKCNWIFDYTVKLNPGKNTVTFQLIDTRGFVFYRTKIFYFFPSPVFYW